MKYYFILLITFTIFLFVRCENQATQSYTTSILFDCDTLFAGDSIPSEFRFQFRYNTFSIDSCNNRRTVHYIISDSTLLSFRIGDNEKELISIPISKNYPLYSVLTNERDTFLLQSQGCLYKKVNDTFNLEVDFNKTRMMQENGLIVAEVLSFDRGLQMINDSLIIIPITSCFKRKKGIYGDGRMKYPLFAAYNLETKKIKYLNYFTPDHYLRGVHYIYDAVQSEVKGDTLFVSYPYKDEIDLFSISQNKLIKSHSFRSYYHSDDIEEIRNSDLKDSNLANRYRIETGHYGSFIHNPYNGFFYRVFYHALPTKNEEGKFTIYSDKSSSIAVYDSKFKFLGEHKFDNGYFVFMGMIPDENGLLIKSFYNFESQTINFVRLKHKWKK